MCVKSDGTIFFTDPPYGILSDYEGYTAALVEVVFDPNGDNPLILSTGTLVTPKEYPFEKYAPEKSLGTKKN